MSPLQLYCMQGGVSPQGGVCLQLGSAAMSPLSPTGGGTGDFTAAAIFVLPVSISHLQDLHTVQPVPREGGCSPQVHRGGTGGPSPQGGGRPPQSPCEGEKYPSDWDFLCKNQHRSDFPSPRGGCQPPKSPGGVAGTVPGPCVVNINI